MNSEDAKNPYLLKLLSGGGDQSENQAILEKFREYGREFDPTTVSPDALDPATREALDYIEEGVGQTLPEEYRVRYILHLEKLSFIRAKMEQEKQGE